jgi:hypothetical protein
MAKKETTFVPRVALRVWTENDNGYFSINAEPCVLGPRYAYERERVHYDEVGGVGSGWSDLIRGLRLYSLRITSQGNNGDEKRKLYSFSLRYFQLYSVDLSEARQMAKTLETIEKRVEKLNDKYGRLTTFAQYVARIVDAIGAEGIVIRNDEERKRRMGGEVWRVRDVKQGLYEIDMLEHEWITERERAEEERQRERREEESRAREQEARDLAQNGEMVDA